jgi:hypothetical protein
VGVQLVNAKVRSRRSVAADLGEEDPDGEIARIVEEAQRLAALVATEAGSNEDKTAGPHEGGEQLEGQSAEDTQTEDGEEDDAAKSRDSVKRKSNERPG